MTHSKKQKAITLMVYFLLFYAVWAVYHVWIAPFLTAQISSDWLCSLVANGIFKNLIWTLPAAILLCRFSGDVYATPKECFSWNRNQLPWLLVFPFFAVYLLFGAYRLHGSLQILPDFGLSSVIVVLFVGLTEELVFRGWLLNLTYSESHKEIAIGINAVLFLMIHFPKWMMDGTFFSNFAHFGFISILLLSVLFSVIFVKTKSLLLPIGLHMFWDFLMMMVY